MSEEEIANKPIKRGFSKRDIKKEDEINGDLISTELKAEFDSQLNIKADEINLIDEHIPIKTKIAYGIGTNASALLSGLVFASITFFYNTKLGMDENLLGIAWMLFGIWNAINDPLFGAITDNTRSSIGRRIPYIRYGSIFYGLTFIWCWYPFAHTEDQTWLFVNFILAMVLLDSMFSIVGTCYFCLPNEMAITAHERGSIGLVTSVLSIFVILIQLTVPVYLLTGDSTTLNSMFRPTMILIGIICSALMFGTSYFLKENEFAQMQETDSLWEGMKLTLKNKAFFLFEVGNFTLTLLLTILGTGIFYYIQYVVELDLESGEINADLIVVAIFILVGLLLGAGFALRKIEELQPRTIGLVGFAFGTVGFLGFYTTAFNLLAAAPFLAIIVFGAANMFIALPALIGDVIDNDELITGKRREGNYAGFNALITKPAISLANWIFLYVINRFGFKRPIINGSEIISFEQTYQAQIGIVIGLTLIPAFFMLISFFSLLKYPLHGDWWREKKVEIQKIHLQKEKEYQLHILKKKEILDIDIK